MPHSPKFDIIAELSGRVPLEIHFKNVVEDFPSSSNARFRHFVYKKSQRSHWSEASMSPSLMPTPFPHHQQTHSKSQLDQASE